MADFQQRNCMSAKPNLLFLCQTLPFPPDSGVNIRSFNILRLLSTRFDVVALCFYRARSRTSRAEVEAGIAGLQQYARVEAFPIPQEHNKARWLADHARSVMARQPYTRYAYMSRAFTERLEYWLATQDFALVHIDSLDLMAYLPALANLPTVCVHHNVESDLLTRRAAQESNSLTAAYMRHQASLVQSAERRLCEQVDINVMVSETDERALRSLDANIRTMVVPNGVDTDYFRPVSRSTEGVVYAGGINWYPNRDALQHFANDILPLLRARAYDAPVVWVGRTTEEIQRRYRDSGITITGRVPDVRPLVQGASCYIVPIRVGGGTRLKILDAWAMGMAVVSTSIGCEGLRVEDGRNIIVRDTPDGFADAVLEVLRNLDLRRRLQNAGRDTVEQYYDWARIGEKMLPAYLTIANLNAATPPLAEAPQPRV